MRKILKAILTLAAILLCFSCSKEEKRQSNNWMAANGKIKVCSTIAQIGDLVEAIGGERIDACNLIRADLDPHSYELVKGDGEKLARADLIFYSGLGLEHGASLHSLLKASPSSVAVAERVAASHPSRILKKGSEIDPHLWMDVSLWERAVEPIQERLSALDPEGSAYYAERARQLTLKLDSLHEYIHDSLQAVPSEKRYLVTSHDAFRYFAKAYLAEEGEENWEERCTAPEGLSPDGQLNPLDIRRSLDFLRAHKISVLFPESNVNRDSALKIASAGRELGLQLSLCSEPLYGDSTSGLSYFEMMKKNADVISQHLQ